MGLFKKAFRKNMVTLQKFKPVFTTVDGHRHTGFEYNYGIVEKLRCSVPEYMMIDIKRDGYLEDNYGLMYPLANIVSIDWQLVDEKKVEDKFGEYQTCVTTKDVEQIC